MRLRVQHLGATAARTQDHHSGGIRVDPVREGRAAVVRPGGALREWEGCGLDAYLKETRRLAILRDKDPDDSQDEDGWASSYVRKVGDPERDGSRLVATERSRYRVRDVPG